jgi:hypothetical protein
MLGGFGPAGAAAPPIPGGSGGGPDIPIESGIYFFPIFLTRASLKGVLMSAAGAAMLSILSHCLVRATGIAALSWRFWRDVSFSSFVVGLDKVSGGLAYLGDGLGDPD